MTTVCTCDSTRNYRLLWQISCSSCCYENLMIQCSLLRSTFLHSQQKCPTLLHIERVRRRLRFHTADLIPKYSTSPSCCEKADCLKTHIRTSCEPAIVSVWKDLPGRVVTNFNIIEPAPVNTRLERPLRGKWPRCKRHVAMRCDNTLLL